MNTQTFKQGDIVRLTDPLSNGEVVRIESVDEHGYAAWLGGSQNCDMEQIDLIDVNSDLIYYYHSLSELVRHIEEKTGIKLYPESAMEYWKHRAEVAEQENALNEKLLKEEHNKLLDAQETNAKLRFSLSERDKEIERLKDEHKKEMDEYRAVYFRQNKILVEQNNALKRQLDESNKQIEIHSKRERELESELDEYNDERNFI